jgi:hypothetical protein
MMARPGSADPEHSRKRSISPIYGDRGRRQGLTTSINSGGSWQEGASGFIRT